MESEFKVMPLRDEGVWGKQNDKLDRWIATGPDERLRNWIQIGDQSSHWPGKDHMLEHGYRTWMDSGDPTTTYHSQVVVIHPCDQKVDSDDKWYNYQEEDTTCAHYRARYCADGKPKPEFIHLFGEHYNYPEHNCYDCGRNLMDGHLSTTPSKEPSKCTHEIIQSRSKFVVDVCSAKTAEGACQNPSIDTPIFITKYSNSHCQDAYRPRIRIMHPELKDDM